MLRNFGPATGASWDAAKNRIEFKQLSAIKAHRIQEMTTTILDNGSFLVLNPFRPDVRAGAHAPGVEQSALF
jgi:hypothetical protein